MTQKIYIVEGRQFRTEADYQNALKDQQVIENLRMQTKKMNLSDQKKLLEVIRSGKCRFHSILGQDYMEELAEEIHRQERKDAPVSRANATKKKEPLKKPVKKKETPKHRKAAQKQKKTPDDDQALYKDRTLCYWHDPGGGVCGERNYYSDRTSCSRRRKQ